MGVKNDKNEVIAACLLTEHVFLNSTNISTHRGPLLDYFDAKLVCYFLKNYLNSFIKIESIYSC